MKADTSDTLKHCPHAGPEEMEEPYAAEERAAVG
jgi:hypothetical protein